MSIADIIAAHMPSDIAYCEEHDQHEWHCMAGCGLSADRMSYAAHVAAEIEKERTVTTVEELDALPNLSIVKIRPGLAIQKDGIWFAVGADEAFGRELEFTDDAFPARILWLPTDEATA